MIRGFQATGVHSRSGGWLAATNAEMPELIAHRYRILGVLGRGGMGIVHEAIDETTGRRVALKRLRGEPTLDAEDTLRFRREFRTLAGFEHPCIVRVFDYGAERGPYYTMELLEGEDLKDARPESAREVCSLLRDVAAALALVHARGFVHRDLAPRNVRRTADGRAKLIDFGVLANAGILGEIVGTPAYVAPETLRGGLIDGRADLFSLGALGYLLLTGRPPYAATTFGDLERAWRHPPPAPSASSRFEVPAGLDALLSALLAHDPLGRPASAAEVIDRLAAVGELPPAPGLAARRGYLTSAVVVGRAAEIDVLRGAARAAVEGHGRVVVVRGESGTGKSRLLREAALEAQLAGATVASTAGETAALGPYGVIGELARVLLAARPDETVAGARGSAELLGRIFPWLGAKLGRRTTTTRRRPSDAAPGDERLRIQDGVCRWLVGIADRTPLVLVVDDVQRCDEASAAVLAALARHAGDHPLSIVAARRVEEPARAPGPVEALASVATRVDLGGLDAAALGELVSSVFGDVPAGPRLASHLAGVTGGSPLHAIEILRDLVESGEARFHDGLWVLPRSPSTAPRPQGLAGAMSGRIDRLSTPARRLAEVMAIRGGAISLDACAELAGDLAEEALLSALDELVAEWVLLGDDRTYRFRHDGLREALLRGLDDARRRRLHRAVGESLVREGLSSGDDARIGWHLYEGGDDGRGADLLHRAGVRLFEAQALSDCIAPLEAALSAFERRGAPAPTRMHIRHMLLAAGWTSDRAAGWRHALAAVTAYRRQAGLALAAELQPWLGPRAGFLAAMGAATVRWRLAPPAKRGPSPSSAAATFVVSLAYACGLAYAENRKADLADLIPLADPLQGMDGRLPYVGYLTIQSFADILHGRFGIASRRLTEGLAILGRDHWLPLSAAERAFTEAGIRGLRVLVDVNQFNPRLHDDLRAIDGLGIRYYQLVAQATRVGYYRYRGEEGRARAIERAMETPTIQLGSWSTDVQILFLSHPAFALCDDVLGLKRCVDELERLIEQGFRVEARAAVARAEWQRARGDAPAALAALEAVLDTLDDDDFLVRQWTLSAAAEAAVAAGSWATAAAHATACVRLGGDPDVGLVLPRLRATRCLALADAALGRSEAAVDALARGVTECERIDCPPLAGAFHAALATTRLQRGEDDLAADHTAAALRWFKRTGNPALLAMGQRLLDAVGRSAPAPPDPLPDATAEAATARFDVDSE